MQQRSVQVFDRLILEEGQNASLLDLIQSDLIQMSGNQLGVAFTVINTTGTFATGFPRVSLLGSIDGRAWKRVATLTSPQAFGYDQTFSGSWDYPFFKVEVAIQAESGTARLLCDVFVTMSDQGA